MSIHKIMVDNRDLLCLKSYARAHAKCIDKFNCLAVDDKKETARSSARPSSRKVIEFKQSERAAPESAAAERAAEAPEPEKETTPRVPRPAVAERTSSAPKVIASSRRALHG